MNLSETTYTIEGQVFTHDQLARMVRAAQRRMERNLQNRARYQQMTEPDSSTKGRPFLPVELDLIQNTNLTHMQVAQLTGRSYLSISQKRFKMGINVNRGHVIVNTSKVQNGFPGMKIRL